MEPGTTLRNRYRILQKLGSGGFGKTYLAEDRDLPGNSRCVVKHFQPTDPRAIPVAKRLFQKEAEILNRLGRESRLVPTLYAYFEEGGQFYLVQEYIDGDDLGKEIVPGKQLRESEVRALLAAILESLEVAHRQNVIHRDIKPQNLMRRRGDGKIVLIDFGAVKEIEGLAVNREGDTRVTVTVGTPGYMPSEQAAGRPTLSSDIHAAGILGIQALTGLYPKQLLKDPRTGETIWRDRVSVSKEFGDILEKMVRDHFSQRFVDAMEARSVLVPPPPPPPPPRRQFLWWLVFGGMGFAGAVFGRSLLDGGSRRVSQSDSPSPQPVSPPPSEPAPPSPEPALPPEPAPPPKVTTTQLFTTVKVNSQGQIVERLPGEAEVLAENLGNGISLEMVSIPGGRFLMGSPENEEKRDDSEGPQRYVNVPPFFLGKYPVTQGQYQAVMGNNPSGFKGANRPVETVTWNDATEFCQKLSQRTGKIYRLPSEAEWEYACRGGTTTPFYFGETITADLANYRGTSTYASEPEGVYREETTDVGSFPPNAFGLYDMHGNVWEWCQDVWHSNYNGAPTDGSAWVSGGARMLRGGSWLNNPENCRSANRNWLYADSWNGLRGFRVVLLPGL